MAFWKLNRKIINNAIISIKLLKSELSHNTNALPQLNLSMPSTIDPRDVNFFSLKYNKWWDINGPMKLLHTMNVVRIPLIRNRFLQGATVGDINLPLKGMKLLDVGCGGGILSEGLAKLGADVTGVDASKELIQVAQERNKINNELANNKPTYYCTTIQEHASTFSDQYDGLVASEVIEHVNNPKLFVKSCVQALKPGGRILFTTPNRTRLSQFIIIFFSENVIKIIPKGTHQYEKFLTPNELKAILEKNNCTVEYSSGLACNPLMAKWWATNSQSMVFVMQASKIK